MGPIELVIESILKPGAKVSDDFVIYQANEQHVDVL